MLVYFVLTLYSPLSRKSASLLCRLSCPSLLSPMTTKSSSPFAVKCAYRMEMSKLILAAQDPETDVLGLRLLLNLAPAGTATTPCSFTIKQQILCQYLRELVIWLMKLTHSWLLSLLDFAEHLFVNQEVSIGLSDSKSVTMEKYTSSHIFKF